MPEYRTIGLEIGREVRAEGRQAFNNQRSETPRFPLQRLPVRFSAAVLGGSQSGRSYDGCNCSIFLQSSLRFFHLGMGSFELGERGCGDMPWPTPRQDNCFER